jgi:hypothetical protein
MGTPHVPLTREQRLYLLEKLAKKQQSDESKYLYTLKRAPVRALLLQKKL